MPPSTPRLRTYPRPPKVDPPADVGDPELAAAIDRYQKLFDRWASESQQVAKLTEELAASEAADDLELATAIERGRAEPDRRKATEQTQDRLAKHAHKMQAAALAAGRNHEKVIRLFARKRKRMAADARQRERQLAIAALETLATFERDLEQLHAARAIVAWVEQSRAQYTYPDQMLLHAGRGDLEVPTPTATPSGYFSDEVWFGVLRSVLLERAAEDPEPVEEQPVQLATGRDFAPAVAVGQPGPGSPEGLALARQQAG